jgi:cytoskeletal protein RodZ
MRISNLFRSLGEWLAALVVVSVLVAVVVVMFFYQLLPSYSESAQHDVSEYKGLSQQQSYGGVSELSTEKSAVIQMQVKTHPYLTPSSGTTVTLVAMQGANLVYEKLS